MKRIIGVVGGMLMMATMPIFAQETTVDTVAVESNSFVVSNDTTNVGEGVSVKNDSVPVDNTREKIDGVASVVGDYVILESDIDKSFLDMKTQGVATANISRCQVLGKLMEDKLYAHQAIQDSIVVSDVEINSTVDRQLQFLLSQPQIGSMEKLVAFYGKEDEQSLREELFKVVKAQELSRRMQAKVVEGIEITPEEVRQWYTNIPDDERPVFGDEVEIAQIVKIPEPSKEEVEKTINKLKEFKRDVEENGSSFAIKQTLYSEDPGKAQNGGVYSITKKSGFVQEFKDAAFSLKQGEISEPFKTEFGYHILYVEKIRGQERDVRHILLRPEISSEAIEDTKAELDSIRSKIMQGKFTFEEAARNFSDEKETRFDGGVLRNPETFDTKFELTKMDPALYGQISPLQGDEISQPLMEETRTGVQFKLLKVINRFKSHKADYSQDYVKIKELALKEKQFKEIGEWMEEKIEDTYINVAPDNRDCDFANNWSKK
ncbi:peptidylprolyl isomerase [Galbibacter mesophilus]|uniref:peptidylprolyl isomerase n=1 Tax=Galbibacter mesophilus TaxID=379069 RepID=UPI00191EED0F|nr:peptidylprolyl isomerase [Galbibacter mesophilus]MCM5662729.1 peptidylprolyl isomerase [Galbibacter mesophilus]